MRFKQTNGREFKERCECERPNALITKTGKVTASELLYSDGVTATHILLDIDLRRIPINKISHLNITLCVLSFVQL